MPKRTDIHKVLIIGSGPIIIGQACEFDYSGTQACKALKKLGYEIVLVNSNPATIMTDPETADVTYIEPLNVDRLEQIIKKERPDALLPNLGGQSGLNLCAELYKAGILGPSYGLLAAGIGSAMSDLLSGYFVYVPITFVIKGLIALFSGLVYQKIAKDSKSRYVAVLLGGVIDIVLVAGGYFICEFFLYGSSAAASIPANIIQGIGGLIISFVLYPVLMAIPDVKQLTYKTK